MVPPSPELTLLEQILAHQPIAPETLCDQLGLDSDSLIESITRLNAAGIPIDFGQQGYSVPGAMPSRTDGFTPQESSELAMALTLLEEQGWITPERREILIGKLFPRSVEREWIDTLSEQVRVDAPVTQTTAPEWIQRLNEAIRQRDRLTIHYQSLGSEEGQDRDISPYTLVHRRESWYVIAYCHLREDLRTFKLNRIHSLTPTPEPFFEDPEFDPDRYLLYKWNILGGTNHVVMARFDATIGPLILEKQINHGKVWKENGFVYMQAIVSGLDEFGWWIMQYGEHAEVLQPRELRRTLALRSARMAERYRDVLLDRG